MKSNWKEIGDEYIQATSYKDSKEYIDTFEKRPTYNYALHNLYMKYSDAKVRTPLRDPDFHTCPAIWTVLQERRSGRKYLNKPLTFYELNMLLWSFVPH